MNLTGESTEIRNSVNQSKCLHSRLEYRPLLLARSIHDLQPAFSAWPPTFVQRLSRFETLKACAMSGPFRPQAQPFSLRLATSDDAEQVASLIARVWTKHFAWSVPADDLDTHLKTQLSVDRIRASILDAQMRFIIAVTTDAASEESSDTPHATSGDTTAETRTSTTRDPGIIMGVAQLIFNANEDCLTLPNPVELNRLYVEDEYRGAGLASVLIDEAGRVARVVTSNRIADSHRQRNDTGARCNLEHERREGGPPGHNSENERCSLWLGVWEDNARAIRFYEKMGFKAVGEHKFMVGKNVRRDLVMEKSVD